MVSVSGLFAWRDAMCHVCVTPVLQACDDLKSQLEQQKATHSEQLEQQRQSFATEKSATTKRYQVGQRQTRAQNARACVITSKSGVRETARAGAAARRGTKGVPACLLA